MQVANSTIFSDLSRSLVIKISEMGQADRLKYVTFSFKYPSIFWIV